MQVWGTLMTWEKSNVLRLDHDKSGGITHHLSIQVKNFGRSGRTKYTHLVDQDTTSFDSAWGQESAQNTKFFKQKAAGVRDVFERPSAKKRKTT